MVKVFLLKSILLLLISSCAKSPKDSLDIQVVDMKTHTCQSEKKLLAAGIVGGIRVTENDSDSKNVMMLFSDGELCTASAISPRVLITAAHCIKGSVMQSWVGLYSSLSCESGFDSRHNTVNVKEFAVHPDYNKAKGTIEYSSNDIALVFLEEALPISYPIYRIANSDLLSGKNSLYFWGYGDIKYKSGGAGILRKTQVARKDFEILKDHKKIRINQSHGHGICQGDSGGPGMVKLNGELQILGVNSYVATGGADDLLCSDKSFLTLADVYIPWMKLTMLTRNEYLKQ